MAYVVGKFMAGYVIKGYDTLLKGDKKIPEDDTYKTKNKGVSEMKFFSTR